MAIPPETSPVQFLLERFIYRQRDFWRVPPSATKEKCRAQSPPEPMAAHPKANPNFHVTALADMISAAVKVVVSEYAAVGHAVPTLESTEPGPFDDPDKSTARLRTAVKTIEAACAQLCATVATPQGNMHNYVDIACIRTVIDARVADHLLSRPEGMHVDELSRLIGIEAGKLARVLRVLATSHCFSEVYPNVFTNNRLSMKLLSEDPVCSLVGRAVDETAPSALHLSEVLRDPKKGRSYLPQDCTYDHFYGRPVFGQTDTPEGKFRCERFAKAMAGLSCIGGRAMLSKVYPWHTAPQGAAIVDVGGSKGHATMDVARAFPHMKVIVQDAPEVVAQGPEYWKTNLPEGNVSFVPIDFFKQSPVSGCEYYYVKHILHDWPDAESIRILQNIRAATKPTSRLLIHDYVLPPVARRLGRADAMQAPEPLLPSYGAANTRPFRQDINMLIQVNGKERTLDEFVELGEKTGWKFVEWMEAGEEGLLEFVPV
ncbi:S-adenosyl-L-methionine-dependent methyltransferase [Schizophyllum commune Loenen D]|nr:S-adenosyl-L-methionine-dependent methyltransferase [Schizophyllum commune Loenen D]